MGGGCPIRASLPTLKEKREGRTTHFLLTGATGFLGSHVAAELIKKGYSLWVVGRPNRNLTAKERVEQIQDWLGVEPRNPAQLRVVEGFLDRPFLGLDPAGWEEILDSIDEIIHCASSTSFAERKRAEVEAANIQGLQNVLQLAEKSRCYHFHYMSTAYVAGKEGGFCREELLETGQFTNVYEETKYRGERMVADLCAREGIRWNIYRPSIVYGDSRSGKSLTFKALYYPVRTVLFFKNLFQNDILEHGGHRAKEMGVRIEADGKIHLPIRLEVNEKGGINLIPINFFLEAFLAIMEECLEGGVFHIVNNRLKKIDDLIEYTQRLFQITGIRSSSAQDFIRLPRNPLEILFDSYLEAYQPYIRDSRVFENQKTEAVLRRRRMTCPDLDFEIFSRCMNYAVAAGWGSKLFPPA
jgi:nucleoside-diphosphate-sugar epimerase